MFKPFAVQANGFRGTIISGSCITAHWAMIATRSLLAEYSIRNERARPLSLFLKKSGNEARVTRTGIPHTRTSDGNFVNAGNFDDDGGNVNRWKPRNSNSNIGCTFSEAIDKREVLRLLFCYFPFRFYPTTGHFTHLHNLLFDTDILTVRHGFDAV